MPSSNGNHPKRAVLYARVSTEEQARSGYSLAQQMEALREYANREGYEVVEEITDPGESGASLAARYGSREGPEALVEMRRTTGFASFESYGVVRRYWST
jgi:DNA invertase Pin-like site-specific DNA recombinase